MSAFLIVEDEELTRSTLASRLHTAFPEGQIDAVSNLADAIRLSRQRSLEGEPYDVALLDVYLPRDNSGGKAEFFPGDRHALLSALGHSAVVINYSTRANDEDVRRFIDELNDPNAPRPLLLHASPSFDWQAETVELTRRAIYGRRVAARLDRFQSDRPATARRSGVAARVGTDLEGTQALAALARDIKQHWEYLDEEIRNRARTAFDIREVGGQVLVNL